MKRTGHLLLAGSALSGAVALVAGCRGGTQAQAQMAPPPPAVSVAAVEERKITEWDEFIGRLEAIESVEIRPRVAGYIDDKAYTYDNWSASAPVPCASLTYHPIRTPPSVPRLPESSFSDPNFTPPVSSVGVRVPAWSHGPMTRKCFVRASGDALASWSR